MPFERGNLRPCLDVRISQSVLKIALLALWESRDNMGLFCLKSLFVVVTAQRSASKYSLGIIVWSFPSRDP